MTKRRRRLLTRLASALVIGVATIFVPKVDPTTHWSIPPTMDVHSPIADAGDDGERL